MTYSMTGFGKAKSQFNRSDISIEIRSVNNRFQELFVRLPKLYQIYEYDVRERISKQISRGKISVNVQITDHGQAAQNFSLNKDLTKRYLSLLDELKELANIKEDTTLSHLLTLEEIFIQEDDCSEDDAFKKKLLELSDEAVSDLNQMRFAEGEGLIKDLQLRNQMLRQFVESVEKQNEKTANTEFEKLKSRVAQLLTDTELDQDRLITELSLIADRSDVTEECVRLRSHTELFEEELKKDAPGKRLNFLLQEMNREVNTIGSKTPNIDISHAVVSAKQEVEKMREQVQNLE